MSLDADDLYREVVAAGKSLTPAGEEQDSVVDLANPFAESETGDDALPRPTIADTVAAFEAADGLEEIFAIVRTITPPPDAIDRRLLREKLLPVFKEKGLNSPAGTIDDWFRRTPAENAADRGGRVTFREPERWADPVDGAELVHDLVDYFAMFVVAPSETLLAAALWVMFTHVYDVFDITPILLIASPTKRCGKTTLLDLIYRVAARGLMSSNITGPGLFRTIEMHHPTLLIDEAEQFTKLNPELQGILNAGHRRTTARVIRTVGDNFEPRQFSTWAPKAMTTIGTMPDSVEDRAIRLTMSRKRAGERKVPAIGRTMDATSLPLLARCARWAEDNGFALRSLDLPYLDGLHDRAKDNWAPLLGIADLCGDDVSRRVRQAALTLTAGEEASAGELLLGHVRDAFGDQDKITTADLLRALIERDDGPWAKWWANDVEAGRIKAPGARLAKLLKPFGPEPKQLWIDGRKERGYESQAFTEAWDRYLGHPRPDLLTNGRTVDGMAEEASDLPTTVLPFPEGQSPAYQPDIGSSGCSACGGTFGHMSTCPRGGS